MKQYILISTIFISVNCLAQSLVVNSGNLSIGKNTALCLYQTSLLSHGAIKSIDTSIVAFSDPVNVLSISGSSTINLFTVYIKSNCVLTTDLELSGDLILTNGSIDIGNSNIILGGNLQGENEQYRLYSESDGQINKTIDLKAGQTVNPGNLGLELIPGANYSNVSFTRSHAIQTNGYSNSIKRSFALPNLNEEISIHFKYFDSELNNLSESQLKLWTEQDGVWEAVENSLINIADNNCSSIIGTQVDKISLFEYFLESELKIPNGFSPNNDGENDFFIITGAEKSPQNKLIVFNQWGDILFEAAPYENNWGGENKNGKGSTKNEILPDGTYFFIFYENKNDVAKTEKGFIEIKSGKNQ